MHRVKMTEKDDEFFKIKIYLKWAHELSIIIHHKNVINLLKMLKIGQMSIVFLDTLSAKNVTSFSFSWILKFENTVHVSSRD